ncbi:E3 ubiquitin- ligase rififylin-like [Brachionus plicatilis]|uniref:E3 ubiquitin-ligase rififylin-like n=1 Tax=Brachionus plicatilis TaxID=10195 RepID=A0A3M7PWX9_BRAPC|nr:E3 ubiquitin- ligase rififylin-like [Brachionus plicatilis]
MFNIFGEQIPNVFSHFNVNSETNTQSQPPPTQSQPRSTEPRSQPMQSEPSQSQSTTIRRASLTDLKCPEDIDHLSIKQIKEILANNFVEYKGCCERSELVDKLKRLFVSDCENKRREQQLNNPSTNNDSRLNSEETDVCKICMESIMDCVLLDCGHMCSCIKCGKQLAECPICRQNVVRVVLAPTTFYSSYKILYKMLFLKRNYCGKMFSIEKKIQNYMNFNLNDNLIT